MTIKPWIIKAGGELLANKKIRQKILKALAKTSRKKPLVFVHGGGPQIAQALNQHKIKFKFLHGRRITTPKAMTVIERVLSGEINKSLVADLNRAGCLSVGLSARDGKLIQGKPFVKGGRSATPQKINPKHLQALMAKNILPVVSSIASDSKGKPLNINADDAACALAISLKAPHLILLTNTSGVKNQKNNRIPVLNSKQSRFLIKKGVIQGGMIPKVQSALKALQKGVKEVNILNGSKGIQFSSGTRLIK